MRLLDAIAQHRSINRAARHVPLSCKAAWEAVDVMNRLSAALMVLRRIGGRASDGTRLTVHGQRMLAPQRAVQDGFQATLDGAEPHGDQPVLRRLPRPTRRVMLLAAVPLAGVARAAAPRPQDAGPATTVSVAVAANFAAPLVRIAEGFTAATGHRVRVSAGATGKFYTQIAAGGAPFEVLLSADEETPARLLREGHAVAGTAFSYAIGRLVLWSATPGLVDAEGAVLRSRRFARLAVANPRVAPYGRAAQQVMQALGLAQALAPKLVTGDSIAQTFQFTATGNAEIGFVALSQVKQPGRAVPGSMWLVPQTLYATLRQDAVLLRSGERNPAARALLAHLASPAARAVMGEYGYRH